MKTKYGAVQVSYYLRANGRWAIRWREAGEVRTKTFTGSPGEAAEEARKIAKKADAAGGGRVVTVAEYEALESLRTAGKSFGGRSVFDVVADAVAALGWLGGEMRLEEAAHVAKSSCGKITVLKASGRFIDLYDQSPTRTRRGLKNELDRFCEAPEHSGLLVEDVSEDLLRRWLRRGGAGGPSPVTFNNRLTTWRNFFARCQEWDYLPHGRPTVAMRIKKLRKVMQSPDILSPDQAAAALNVMRSIMRDTGDWRPFAMFSICCWAGLRPSESQRLQWSAFDFNSVGDGMIHISPEVAQKLSQERWIPVCARLRALIDELPDGVIKNGGPITNSKTARKMTTAIVGAGVLDKWVPDITRHSWVTYRLATVRRVGVVAEEAGNSESTIRSHYKRPIPQKLGELWFKSI